MTDKRVRLRGRDLGRGGEERGGRGQIKTMLCLFPSPPGQIVHEKIHDEIVERLRKAYAQVKIGDPLEG